jgi:very-long-chain ceramide synthase
MITWFVARHIFYLGVCWSAYFEEPGIIPYGCYTGGMDNLKGPFPVPPGPAFYFAPFTDPEGIICAAPFSTRGFIYMLLALQVIQLLWFAIILKIAWKVLRGGEAEDSRSDDEEEEGEFVEEDDLIDEVPKKEEAPQPKSYFEIQPPLEEEVGVEGIRLTPGRTSPAKRMKKSESASTTGVSLRGHSAHKELLGRIGCDKQS